jgi:hypothetical protein
MKPFRGSFKQYEIAKGARLGVTRDEILLGWVTNCAKVRRDFYRGLSSLSPPHTFDETDSLIIKQLAANKGYNPEVDFEFLLILGEICLRNLRNQPQEEMEVSLALHREKLAIIQQEIEQRKQELEKLSQQKRESLQESKPKIDENLHDIFYDNIFTLDMMEEPVIATDGFTYEKRCILEWLRTKGTSPTTGAVLDSTALIPNHSLKSQINQWREKQARSL